MEIIIPISRYRRELNKWAKKFIKDPSLVVLITRNKRQVSACMSPNAYKENVRLLKKAWYEFKRDSSLYPP